MKFSITGHGTAVPEHAIGAEEALKYATEFCCHTDEQRNKLPKLYRMSGVEQRHSVLLEGPQGNGPRQSFFGLPDGPEDRGPGVARRMDVYEREAGPLAIEASEQALNRSQLSGVDITHLITVSCSGFSAPGVDVEIIKALGLVPTVQRTHVGFMGCHGALNGLRVARGFAESDPDARILLCAVELCSLHYYIGWSPERIVANALFADGAAALVGQARNGEAPDEWKVTATGSCLLPDSEEAMTWRISDHGFQMTLSREVPRVIGKHLAPWLTAWLKEQGLGLDDVGSWAVHPGGPRILDAVGRSLGLDNGQLDASREVLRERGNMSSPTVLFILDLLRQREAARPCVALGFGPGLVAEAALLV
jgi:predicted naringenin-chalcone synthase